MIRPTLKFFLAICIACVSADVLAQNVNGDPTSADLGVTISASPDPVAAGGQITYVVTVTNAGPDTAFGIHMYLPLPAGTTFVSQSNDMSWICFTPAVGAHG